MEQGLKEQICLVLGRLLLAIDGDNRGNTVRLDDFFSKDQVLVAIKGIEGTDELASKLEEYIKRPDTWNMKDKEEADKIDKRSRVLWDEIYNGIEIK